MHSTPGPRPRGRAPGILPFLLALLLPGCSDSDNFSWVVVSNPSGDTVPVQGGLVISWRNGNKNLSVVTGGLDGGRPVALRLDESGGPRGDEPTRRRTMYLGVDNDLLVIDEADRGEYHTPVLPAGRAEIPPGALVQVGGDSATGLQLVTPGSRLRFAAAGNVAVREESTGVVVLRPEQPDQHFAFGSVVESSGEDYLIEEPGGRRTLIPVPPSAAIGSQARFDTGRQSYRFYSYGAQFTAELPASRFVVFDGSGGIALDGAFPDAAGGALDSPFRAVLASRNHHLLLVRAPY